MEDIHKEKIEYQKKYGIMKDYISCQKEDKKRMNQGDVIEFNNKQLITYLEDRQEGSLNEKRKEEMEYLIMRSCFMLQSGFNVCFHGFGSKRNILNEISNLYTDIPKLIVQGYSPATQVQQILTKLKYIVTKVVGVSSQSGSKRSEGIIEYLKQSELEMDKHASQVPFILIVFHNLDAKQFIDQDQIRLISKIFNLSFVRAICSVDHVKFSTAFTPKILERFNFAFYQFNSHDCYLNEFKVGQNTFTIKKEKEGEALKYILRSLTKVQKEIIQFLAKYIRDNLEKNPGTVIQQNGQTEGGKIIGVTLKELLEMLIDEMILNSEQQLKENLLEILDHKVIISLESQQKTFYTMNYSKLILDKIINNQLEEEEEEEEEAAEEQEQEENNEDDMQDEKQKESSCNSNSQSEDEKPKKRGRRQQKRKISSQSSNSNSSSQSNSEDEQEKPKKRGPGRPPSKNKQKNKKKTNYISETSEEEEND